MPSLREALEDTYDELDAGAAVDDGGVAPDIAASQPDAGTEADGGSGSGGVEGDRTRDESGRFVTEKPAAAVRGTPAARSTATGAQAGADVVAPGGPPAAVAAPTAPPASVYKPPQSWKAAIREKWGTLPPEVQAEVVRREKEAAQALQARAEAEKGTATWQQAVRPYEAQIRASGATPEAYVGDLLKTAHALTYSAPAQKADLLANLIMQFGVAPQDLDQALVARMNGQGAPRAQPQQPQDFRDPRLDQFFAQQEAHVSAEAEEKAASLADSYEFFEDVADDVAHQIDLWQAKGNKTVSDDQLERFYNVACQLNPDVQEALNQRKVAKTVATVQAATQRAKSAASSVRNQPTAAGAAQPVGLRAALEATYDELDR